MKKMTLNTLKSLFVTMAFGVCLTTSPLVHAKTVEKITTVEKVTTVEKSARDYLHTFPWIGLILDEVSYGPMTIKHVRLNDGDKLAIVKPGEEIKGTLRYKIDSDKQAAFHRHHLVVGIKGIGAQDCVTHSLGLWDSSGTGRFILRAPFEKGVYEVRFFYREALTCKEAKDFWNEEGEEPSNHATIGTIIVE